MRIRLINTFIATTCVSFTLIVVLFSVLSMLTDFIGPTSPQGVLILLAMCLVISVWTTWLATREFRSVYTFFALAYVGCVGTVLGIGTATSFIPLAQSDASMLWTVLAMITGVFFGTAMYRAAREMSAIARINAKLQALHETSQGARTEYASKARKGRTPFDRFLYMTVVSYTVLMIAAACGELLPGRIILCNPQSALIALPICSIVSLLVAVLQQSSWTSWQIFVVSTITGAGLSDALMMPMGLMKSGASPIFVSIAISAAITACTAAALWSMDDEEAQEINDEIWERRVGREPNHRS